MKKLIILFFPVFLFFCCEKKEDPKPPTPPVFDQALLLKKVTGLRLLDANGLALGQVGNPNTKTIFLGPYPNPCQDVLSIYLQGDLEELYFVKAEPDSTFMARDFADLYNKNPLQLDSIELQKTQSIPVVAGSNNYQFNTENFETGYYRLFYRMSNDSLYVENVYIDPATWPNESLDKVMMDW